MEGKMKKNHVLIILGVVALIFAASAVVAQTVDERIKKGDEFYAQKEDAKAMEEFVAAAQADPKNYEAAWKASRSLIDVGDLVAPKEKGAEAKQKKYFQDATIYARKAVALNPNDTQGHFYVSASLGKYALMLGKKDQVNMSKEIKTEIERAIELDATNDGAFHALGRWHRRMAEIGGATRFFGGILYGSIPKGSFEVAEKSLKKATELKPDFINHHLELARTYVAVDKYKEAVEEYQKCLDLPGTTAKDPAYKKEAEAEIVKAKKKAK
jgi:tetratricopeptide (TPR) repeat protein